MRVLMIAIEVFLWTLSAGFACGGVLLALGAMYKYRVRNRDPDNKWIAGMLAMISIIFFGIFVGCAAGALSIMNGI